LKLLSKAGTSKQTIALKGGQSLTRRTMARLPFVKFSSLLMLEKEKRQSSKFLCLCSLVMKFPIWDRQPQIHRDERSIGGITSLHRIKE
jgi:hypothetical protein